MIKAYKIQIDRVEVKQIEVEVEASNRKEALSLAERLGYNIDFTGTKSSVDYELTILSYIPKDQKVKTFGERMEEIATSYKNGHLAVVKTLLLSYPKSDRSKIVKYFARHHPDKADFIIDYIISL